ncbi:MAG: hypothetical protein ACFN0X_02895 [Mitsuokella sp.]
MEDNIYQFLFPFEKVPQGSRVLIYGAGKVGQAYLEQLAQTRYCHVVGMADKNFQACTDFIVPVYDPKTVGHLSFDFVVIALRVAHHLNEFYHILLQQGIKKEQIIYQSERPTVPIHIRAADGGEKVDAVRAEKISQHGMLLLMTGGLGDYIVHKKTVESLLQLDPCLCVDICCSQGESFVKFLYSDESRVDVIQLDLGYRYEQRKSDYAAAMQLIGSSLIRVARLEKNGISESLYAVLRKLQEESEKETKYLSIPPHIIFSRCIYKEQNCYERMCYGGVIPHDHNRIHIPFDETSYKAFQSYGLTSYITINHGNGIGSDTKQVAKCWVKERFEEVIAGIHKEYPKIKVVQIGSVDSEELNGADYQFLGESFQLVSHLLRNAIFHLDIEGGMVHFASQLGTKCIVLFGPTSAEYNAYDGNITIRAGKCHNCYALYEDVTRCARGMEEPECMYSITPDMVMEQIHRVLRKEDIGGIHHE